MTDRCYFCGTRGPKRVCDLCKDDVYRNNMTIKDWQLADEARAEASERLEYERDHRARPR